MATQLRLGPRQTGVSERPGSTPPDGDRPLQRQRRRKSGTHHRAEQSVACAIQLRLAPVGGPNAGTLLRKFLASGENRRWKHCNRLCWASSGQAPADPSGQKRKGPRPYLAACWRAAAQVPQAGVVAGPVRTFPGSAPRLQHEELDRSPRSARAGGQLIHPSRCNAAVRVAKAKPPGSDCRLQPSPHLFAPLSPQPVASGARRAARRSRAAAAATQEGPTEAPPGAKARSSGRGRFPRPDPEQGAAR